MGWVYNAREAYDAMHKCSDTLPDLTTETDPDMNPGAAAAHDARRTRQLAGSYWKCDTCGTYWYVSITTYGERATWWPVEWWMLDHRLAIRRHEHDNARRRARAQDALMTPRERGEGP